MHLFYKAHLLHHCVFHMYYFERFPIFQGNDRSRRVDHFFMSSKSWNSNILLNMVILFLLFMKVMLSALVKEVREEGGQRRYEVIEITNIIIMFTSDSKKRKFRNVQNDQRIKF